MKCLRNIFLLLLAFLCGLNALHARGFSRVIIDPGHGGKDKGAIWGGVRECDLNLKVARKAANILRANGVPVTMTRNSHRWVSLSQRAAIANRYNDVIFVSIHFNASTYTYARGAETFYASRTGKSLATSIQSNMVRKLQLKDRKTRLGRQYAVLNQTHCPAVLVECGYISNTSERLRCKRSYYHSLAASAIAQGILQHY